MIDDVLTVTKCGVDSIEVNCLVNMKMESTKLRLSLDKSHHIHLTNSADKCDLDLKVHETSMKNMTFSFMKTAIFIRIFQGNCKKDIK